MAIDPVTGSLILGGIKTLGSLFGGPSPAERQARVARERIDFDRDRFRRREGRRDEAIPFARARSAASEALRNRLLGEAGRIRAAPRDLTGIFSDPTNAFSRPPAAGQGLVPLPDLSGVAPSGPSVVPPTTISDQLARGDIDADELRRRVMERFAGGVFGSPRQRIG